MKYTINREQGFIVIFIIFILGIILKMYLDSDFFQLKCILSNVDGNKYCVRDRSKAHLVADILAKTSNKMVILVDHLKEKYPNRNNIKRLTTRFNPKKITETLPTSKFTAYSQNKGEKIAFCVTTEKDNDNLIDENTLMFVAMHEMSHIFTKSIGHTEEFWTNFKFLIENAVEIDIYKPENYKNDTKRFCGMDITDNPYYDI